MYAQFMSKSIFAVAAIVSLSSLLLVGCQSTELMPKSPYFGVDHQNRHYVPEELHERTD